MNKHKHQHNHQHGHEHNHHNNEHCHHHKHCHHHEHEKNKEKRKILILRPQSGISGDMLLSGLTMMTETSNEELKKLVEMLKLSVEDISISVEKKLVNEITGYTAKLHLPHEHEHRNLKDIIQIINNSEMTEKAKEYAIYAFTLLAQAEADVHGASIDEVHFHEVGALDSIIDTCLCAMLFDKLNPDYFICGALPIADGKIECAHGTISAPAPAVLHLLKDVKITHTNGIGEMVTPTALSLLKAFHAQFGNWTDMTVETHCIIYGSRIIPNIPNGAIFVVGSVFI